MKMIKKTLLMIFSMMIILNMTLNVYAVKTPSDGNYKVDIIFTGGTGKVTAKSPVDLTVSGGKMTAKIILTSSNYTYMVVDGIQYDNIAAAGQDSAFIIPISALDTEINVMACTVAMSTPHEIEYTIKLSSEGTISDKDKDVSQDTKKTTNENIDQNIVNNPDDSNNSTSEDLNVGSEKEISKDNESENLEITGNVDEKDNIDEESNLEDATIGNDKNEIEKNNIEDEIDNSNKVPASSLPKIIIAVIILSAVVAGIIFKKKKSSNI